MSTYLANEFAEAPLAAAARLVFAQHHGGYFYSEGAAVALVVGVAKY